MIARAFVHFYDKPRGRLLTLIGAFFITPIIWGLKKDIARMEYRMNETTILLGKLELTRQLIIKWWTK